MGTLIAETLRRRGHYCLRCAQVGAVLLLVILAGCRQAPESRTREAEVTPVPAVAVPAVDPARLQAHVTALAALGVRRAGTPAEAQGADYIAGQFTDMGYDVQREDVPLPNGRTSHNVWAELPGSSSQVLLISGHMDSKNPSPGANDDASGVAVVLELARVLHGSTPPITLRFTAFGAEEIIDGKRDHHHFGSRQMAGDAQFRKRLAAVASLDMVGVGSVLHIDNQGWAADRWRDTVARCAKARNLPVRCGRSRPVSDHESFERKGIATAYLHWEYDPHYHKATDKPQYVQTALMRQTTEVMLDAIRGWR